jgi:hypothetical protein
VKLGASAFSCFFRAVDFADVGISTGFAGGLLAVAEVVDNVCASFVPLVDLEPGCDPDEAGPLVLGIDFMSEMIFCRLANTSPPPIVLCFFEAASTAASIAVRGAETAVWIERGVGADWESCDLAAGEEPEGPFFVFEF